LTPGSQPLVDGVQGRLGIADQLMFHRQVALDLFRIDVNPNGHRRQIERPAVRHSLVKTSADGQEKVAGRHQGTDVGRSDPGHPASQRVIAGDATHAHARG
jgi:hypothetical protein